MLFGKKMNSKALIILGIILLVLVVVIVVFVLNLQSKLNFSYSPEQKEEKQEAYQFQDLNDEVVSQLNTPQKLVDYLNQNFRIEDREEEKPLEPREFFETKKGTQWDFAVFATYILWKNHYDCSIIRYKYGEGKINAVVVFRDKDLPKTIIFTPQGVSIYAHGWSFEEMLQKEEKRLGTKITEYSVSYWTDKGELWPEEWYKRNP